MSAAGQTLWYDPGAGETGPTTAVAAAVANSAEAIVNTDSGPAEAGEELAPAAPPTIEDAEAAQTSPLANLSSLQTALPEVASAQVSSSPE